MSESCWLRGPGQMNFCRAAIPVSFSFHRGMLLRVRERNLQVSWLKRNTLKRSRKHKPGQGMSVQGDVQGKGL